MVLTLHTSIEPARLSLFLALGLLGACGSGGTASETGGSETTQVGSTGSTGSTGAPTPTTGETASTGEPTGGGTGTSASSGEASTGSTGSTSGVSASTTGETTGTTTDGSSGAESSSGTGDDGSSGGDTDGPACTQLMQGFVDPPVPSGWEKCGDKLPHRVSAEMCEVPATPSNCDLKGEMCETNADCKEKPFGSCQKFSIQLITCGCVYGCETDADCDEGFVCRCAGDILGPSTQCVPSTCEDDGDCKGELCQFSTSMGYDCGEEVINGACTTPKDICDTDPPCVDTPCAFVEDKWQCSLIACGRPFVVEAAAVTAPVCAREDWGTAVPVVAVREELSSRPAGPGLRAALADAWTEIGLAEHASVASFARFVLQLLAVGAPPALVLAGQQALADEVEHARVAFALASQFAGRGVGPGPLPQATTMGASELDEIVAAVIEEACVGETLSALEVREAAARAEDPGLRRVLAKIADDEQRHAELGWRFVQWALAGASAERVAAAQQRFAVAIAAARASAERMAELSHGTARPELRAYGVIDAPLRAELWRRGLQGLVMPAAAALRAA